MTRENRTQRISVSETATHKGFTLRFDYSNDGNNTKPTTVNVTGSKTLEGNASVSVNASMSQNAMNVSFNPPSAADFELAQELTTEMQTILNTEL